MTRSSLPLLLSSLALACGDPAPDPCGEARGTVTLEVYRGAISEGLLPAHGNAVLAPAEEVTVPACGETIPSRDGRYAVPIRGDVVHLRVHCASLLGATLDVVRHASDPGPWRLGCPGENIGAPSVASVFVEPGQLCSVQAHIGDWSSDAVLASGGGFEARLPIPSDRPREALVVHTCTASGAPFLVQRALRSGRGDWSVSVDRARAVAMVPVPGLGALSPGRHFQRLTAAGTRIELPITEAGEVYDLPAALADPDDAVLSLSQAPPLSWMSWGRALDPIAPASDAPWQRRAITLTRDRVDLGDPDADRVVVEGASAEGRWVLDISRAAFGAVDLSTLPDSARPTRARAVYYRQLSGAPGALDRLMAYGFAPEDLGERVQVVARVEDVLP